MATQNTAYTSKNAQTLTKKERREQAREKNRILREQEAKRRKRNKMLVIGGCVVALLVIIGVIVQIFAKNTGASEDDFGSYNGSARPAELANVTKDYGIDVSPDGMAGVSVSGLNTISIYSDYTCHGCQNLEKGYSQKFHALASQGKLNFRLYPVATLGNELSDDATAAMFYVATYAPQKAWAYSDALMARGTETVANHAPIPPKSEYADIAIKVGVPEEVANDLPASIASREWKDIAVKATESFRAKDYTATPTLEINGVKDDSWLEDGKSPQTIIDKALAATPPAAK
ncbi:thioredoxin domain-containing protein [Trueperella sp. LYQ143]|uniref:thioredoxin domain-containing protein n=1 Tax=Trueperella sp. LYQ143 TaxID=3391059 RepID=UPI0039832471